MTPRLMTMRCKVLAVTLFISIPFGLVAQDCSKTITDYRRSVVSIAAEKVHKVTGEREKVTGTGFILDKSGYLLTNNHVVSKGTDIDTVTITGAIGSQKAARTPILVIKTDEVADLALLQMENSSEVYQGVVVRYPTSTSLPVGSPLCSMGFPLDIEFHSEPGTLGGKAAKNGWWSTSMPSNFGESGAPVFDSKERVVALKVAGYDDAQNINLVIPIKFAINFISLTDATIVNDAASNASPAVTLTSGNATVFNGFRYGGQSVFTFSTQKVGAWGSSEADLGVANPAGAGALALLFLHNDAPPYTDTHAEHHDIENAGIIEMPMSTLEEVKECPESNYSINYFEAKDGHIYCVRTRDGRHYAKIRISLITTDRISFDYVYQPSDGSRTF